MPRQPVPKILHQTWKTGDVPQEWRVFARSWLEMHPGWEYRLWTDEDNRAFVAEHYHGLLPTFDAYSYGIQRADAIRYCLLHHFGGVYVDLDIECLQPVDELFREGGFFAVMEPEEQGRRLGQASLLSNALMASSPGHPFLEAVIQKLMSNPTRGLIHRDVLETTGPIMLDAVYRAYSGDDVTALPSHVAFPYVSGTDELERLRTGADAAQRAELIAAGTYAAHYWANTWVGGLAGPLINPEPDGIEGYHFVRGWDSFGHDIANVGRNVRLAAIACSQIEGAVGFNTDGFVKSAVRPRHEWQPMGNGAPDEGLYLKKLPPRRGLLSRLPFIKHR